MGVTHVHDVDPPPPDLTHHGVAYQAVLDPGFAPGLVGSTGRTRA